MKRRRPTTASLFRSCRGEGGEEKKKEREDPRKEPWRHRIWKKKKISAGGLDCLALLDNFSFSIKRSRWKFNDLRN